jgi:plasmid stabilization system protein ParE
VGYSHPDHRRPSWSAMESNSPSEELPALYRAILDRVADLEAAGDRVEAALLRSEATAAYSRAWDERARRRLESLLRHATRPTAEERRRGRPARGVTRPPRTAVAPER